MNLTVSWLLKQSTEAAPYHCLAGEGGLGNKITSINVMDNPDTVPWLKEGELVLSTGYIFTQTNLHVDIIKNLKNQGCAGLGIKIHRYMEEIPSEMIQQANELDFPIISIPFSGTMEEIINMIYHKMFQDEMSESERLTEMYRDILESSLKSQKLIPILKKISQYIRCSVFLLLEDYQLLEYYIFDEQNLEYPFPFMKNYNYLFREKDRSKIDEKEISRNQPVFDYCVEYHGEKYPFSFFPLIHEKKRIGYLVCYDFKNNIENIKYKFLKQVHSILVISILRNQMAMKENSAFDSTFYQKILSNSISNLEHIEMLCRQNGFNFSSDYCCMTIHFRKVREFTLFRQKTFFGKIQEMILQICSQSGIDIRSTIYNNDLVSFLYPSANEAGYRNKQIMDAIHEIGAGLKDKEIECMIGFSYIHHGAHKIYTSYSESLQAFELGQTLHTDQIIFSYEEDVIYHMLERHSTTAELFDYYEFTLKPLEDYDNENDTDLVKTLKEYISCGLNVSQAAKNLFIHRNTMNHRMDQIRELISMDLRNPDHIYLIQTAFYARKLLQF
ncbi:MAG: PucR family transcriptional regulator [Eubacteriales bacterium]|nr:PucR family transcriptional regulator [Eubacteriales bacterium]